ncbi:7-dehydrocholesterol reductase [Thelohanellus kitauei]|uniref:7-dehydrocholesterol reductase n=1 Tax=Thelohanellus kitauei TaxID=669202 RepID=A0A0C2IMX7_THEKT|nr:7-dehydrocholesterol reductase [Thelohanellus kitauei]
MRTIDIAHDHFGFYLAWGDVAWLPFMYTLQGFYLMFHPIELSKFSLYIVSMLGFSSIYLFRKSNNQKEEFRNAKAAGNEFFILDRKADFIEAPYLSPDNKKQISFLLADGYWGISRHFNYLTDLGNALAYSLCCGTNCLLPYFYFIYMTILLLHRIQRDDSRCSAKYKESWKQYCTKVPYKLIPYLY